MIEHEFEFFFREIVTIEIFVRHWIKIEGIGAHG